MSGFNWWARPIKHGRMIIPAEGCMSGLDKSQISNLGISGRTMAKRYKWLLFQAGSQIYTGKIPK
ncbi:hypothetical protein ACVFVO_07715 [Advenella kashmirensis]